MAEWSMAAVLKTAGGCPFPRRLVNAGGAVSSHFAGGSSAAQYWSYIVREETAKRGDRARGLVGQAYPMSAVSY